MSNDNQAIITGTIGKDPDLRYIASGSAIVKFSVATNRRWKNKTSDEWLEETCWHNVIAWGELGENVAASLTKGSRVTVTGRISNRSYEDREGVTKYTSEIVADSVAADLRFATAQVERTERTTAAAPAQPAHDSSADPF